MILHSCFIEYAKPRFATFVKYGKIELTPPSPTEIPTAIAQATGIVKSAMTFKWTQLTVKVINLNKLRILPLHRYVFLVLPLFLEPLFQNMNLEINGLCIFLGSVVKYTCSSRGWMLVLYWRMHWKR